MPVTDMYEPTWGNGCAQAPKYNKNLKNLSLIINLQLQGRLLSRLLTHTHLPGLSSLDQMHLLALADTVSTCNTDFSERFAIDAAKSAIAKENLSGLPEGEASSGKWYTL